MTRRLLSSRRPLCAAGGHGQRPRLLLPGRGHAMRRGCGGPPHEGLPAAGFKFRRRAVAGGSGVCVSVCVVCGEAHATRTRAVMCSPGDREPHDPPAGGWDAGPRFPAAPAQLASMFPPERGPIGSVPPLGAAGAEAAAVPRCLARAVRTADGGHLPSVAVTTLRVRSGPARAPCGSSCPFALTPFTLR